MEQVQTSNNVAGAPISTEDKILETAASATQVETQQQESCSLKLKLTKDTLELLPAQTSVCSPKRLSRVCR